jgi:Tfp pilus assembly protein PilN
MSQSEKTRNKDQEKELIAASKQSQVLRQLLASKIYWTQAFDRIEKIMQGPVVLTTLSADSGKGTVGFQATADSYATVARQLASFTAATGVKDVTVDKIESQQSGGVKFSGTITIDTKAMLLRAVESPARTPTPTPTP